MYELRKEYNDAAKFDRLGNWAKTADSVIADRITIQRISYTLRGLVNTYNNNVRRAGEKYNAWIAVYEQPDDKKSDEYQLWCERRLLSAAKHIQSAANDLVLIEQDCMRICDVIEALVNVLESILPEEKFDELFPNEKK